MKRCLAFKPDGTDTLQWYLLRNFSDSGQSTSGYVENGNWYLRYNRTTRQLRAFNGKSELQNTIMGEVALVVDVPHHVKGDYNAIIEWAKENARQQDLDHKVAVLVAQGKIPLRKFDPEIDE